MIYIYILAIRKHLADICPHANLMVAAPQLEFPLLGCVSLTTQISRDHKQDIWWVLGKLKPKIENLDEGKQWDV